MFCRRVFNRKFGARLKLFYCTFVGGEGFVSSKTIHTRAYLYNIINIIIMTKILEIKDAKFEYFVNYFEKQS